MVLMLVVVGWLYVALLMAVAEATHAQGSLLGAAVTFVLYGALPVALVVYLMGRPARRAARRRREAAEAEAARAEGTQAESSAANAAALRGGAPASGAEAPSGQPGGSGEAAADAVAPVRKEP